MTAFPFSIKHGVPLSPLSTFAIGGFAGNYIPVVDNARLVKVLDFLHKRNLDFSIFSGGSNVVFPDDGIERHLVHLKKGTLKRKYNSIIADAGIPLAKVIGYAVNNALGGLENLSGIPGSVGGALVGNAGAYGSSISDSVSSVEIWQNNRMLVLTNDRCLFGYRDSIFKHSNAVVLRVSFKLKKSNKRELKSRSEKIIEIRKAKYKPGLKCPGSFFKNVQITVVPPGILSKINQSVIIGGKIPAGYLLTEVGARTMKIGGIEVSDFHGNLLLNNMGFGKASEVKQLAGILKKKVYEKFGINLEEEVRFL